MNLKLKSNWAALVFLLTCIATYQNCSPPTGGGAFNLGSVNQNCIGSSCTSPITVGNILVSPSTVAPSGLLAASSLVSPADAGTTCRWQVETPTGTPIGQINALVSAGVCSLA